MPESNNVKTHYELLVKEQEYIVKFAGFWGKNPPTYATLEEAKEVVAKNPNHEFLIRKVTVEIIE